MWLSPVAHGYGNSGNSVESSRSGSAPVTVGGGTSRKTESVNYQSSRTVKRTVLPQGGIKRLSVSVLIDQEVHFEGTGAQAKRVLTAPTPERLKVIHDLAAAAVGLNTERGDQIIVESLPFESTVNLEPPGASAPATQTPALTPIEQLKKNPKMLIGAAVGAAVLLAGLFFLIFKMLKKSPARGASASGRSLFRRRLNRLRRELPDGR